ncbi:hypothetical protein PSTT_14489, partial [Puccinia striiformis]
CSPTSGRNFVQSRTGKIGWLHARKVAQQWHSIKLPNDGAVNTNIDWTQRLEQTARRHPERLDPNWQQNSSRHLSHSHHFLL